MNAFLYNFASRLLNTSLFAGVAIRTNIAINTATIRENSAKLTPFRQFFGSQSILFYTIHTVFANNLPNNIQGIAIAANGSRVYCPAIIYNFGVVTRTN